MVGAKPYGQLQYRDVNGKRMAYVDEGDGDAIVFAHGNPTSSYLWRNVMPHVEGLGRLVAADMVGMGGSDKLRPSGPDRYHYAEQRDYLFALCDALDLGDKLTLVLHDWGSVLGFDWANQHRDLICKCGSTSRHIHPIAQRYRPSPRAVRRRRCADRRTTQCSRPSRRRDDPALRESDPCSAIPLAGRAGRAAREPRLATARAADTHPPAGGPRCAPSRAGPPPRQARLDRACRSVFRRTRCADHPHAGNHAAGVAALEHQRLVGQRGAIAPTDRFPRSMGPRRLSGHVRSRRTAPHWAAHRRPTGGPPGRRSATAGPGRPT